MGYRQPTERLSKGNKVEVTTMVQPINQFKVTQNDDDFNPLWMCCLHHLSWYINRTANWQTWYLIWPSVKFWVWNDHSKLVLHVESWLCFFPVLSSIALNSQTPRNYQGQVKLWSLFREITWSDLINLREALQNPNAGMNLHFLPRFKHVSDIFLFCALLLLLGGKVVAYIQEQAGRGYGQKA